MKRLVAHALAALPATVQRPSYDRNALRSGIVHLGLGAFARAHLAVMTEDAIEAGAGSGWGITGVSLRHRDMHDALAPQQGLYTLVQRDGVHENFRIIGCVRECLVAPDDPAAVLERIAHADTRIVSLTITEKGYLDDDQSSAVGYIVRGLALRHKRGLGPLSLLSLDNLASNGGSLRNAVHRAALKFNPALARWIDTACTFPNSMVDRIVPRTTPGDIEQVAAALGCHDAAPVIAEPFIDWAVEDKYAAGRPDWTPCGARFVADAAPWVRLKLHMVNGAHSALAYLAVMAGWPTVHAALAEPAMRRYIEALMRDEIEPTLVGTVPELPSYRQRLLIRFANPALAHRTQQIAMDGSQKLPLRLLPTVRERVAASQPITHLALAIAAWLHHLRGVDEQGQPYAINDPLAEPLRALHGAAQALHNDHQRADLFSRFAPVFGDLAGSPALVGALAVHLRILRQQGVAQALKLSAQQSSSSPL